MSTTRYFVYPGHTNTFSVILADAAGNPRPTMDIGRITLDFDGAAVVDSDTGTDAIEWDTGVAGEVIFKLGSESIPSGNYSARLVLYEVGQDEGEFYDDISISVMEELTLVATPGAADANTYCTFEEAKAILAKKLYHANWDEASDYDKKIALVMATRLLDDLVDWDGSVYSSTQALRFPRYSVYTPDGRLLEYNMIPGFLKEATAVFADALLAEDLTLDPATKGFNSLKVGPISIDVNRLDRKNIVPKSVWVICQHYGKVVGYKARQRTLQRC
jgi:hypothetical protein